MLDVMYDLPSIPGLTECVITRDAILGTERPILVTERKAESA
jgi:ATP-dependent Clp protease ATP-binding subunit ClpX